MYIIREKMFRLADDSDITDETGQLVLRVDGKIMSLHNRLILRDLAGREVAQVSRRLVALRPTYEITIGSKQAAEVRKHLFTPFREQFTIAVPGGRDMELAGDLLSHEFTIERDGQAVATISKRWLSHDLCRAGECLCANFGHSRPPGTPGELRPAQREGEHRPGYGIR